MGNIRVLFLFAIIALTSCERDKEEVAVKRVPIKEILPVIKIESYEITEKHADLFTEAIAINSQEELTGIFNSLGTNNCDEMNKINYEENTLLVRFFLDRNSQTIPSVAHFLFYHHEGEYYEHHLQLKSSYLKETDSIALYYTGIVIDKIEDNYIKTSYSKTS